MSPCPQDATNRIELHRPSQLRGGKFPCSLGAKSMGIVSRPYTPLTYNMDHHDDYGCSKADGNQLGNAKTYEQNLKSRAKDHSILIFSWNAHSLSTKEKQLFVKCRPHDILCIQEIWNSCPCDLPGNSGSSLSKRTNERGGGSLTLLRKSCRSIKEIIVNKDSKLLKVIVHGNKVLWLCNAYLNKGKTSQIQKLFQTLRDSIPSKEWNRVVIIGDLNINCDRKDDERYKLLKCLAKELRLVILEPTQATYRNSKLDMALVSEELKGVLTVEDSSLSDHLPLSLKINLPFVNKDYSKILIPNSKLAKKLTLASLQGACNAGEWLANHRENLRANSERVVKRIQFQDYERKLLEKLLERKNTSIIATIQDYWNELLLENEKLRFSKDSAKAFKQIRNIFGYHKFEARDGGIVSAVKVGEQIITEPSKVNAALMTVLRNIQLDESRPVPNNVPFPDLNALSMKEAHELVDRMAVNKAISFDLFSDIIFSPEHKEKTANIIKDLWNASNTNAIQDTHFQARLIPLNKKFPDVPKPEDFRPIVVMSPLIKLLEARILDKLQDYLIRKLHRSQIGFVPGFDVSVNIYRALNRLNLRIRQKKRVFCLFLDFKSAYNTIPHDQLFVKMRKACSEDEIQLVRAIYSRLTIKLGDEQLKCNTDRCRPREHDFSCSL